MTISACLIARNEEAQLAECLSGIAGAVDEIVVVDTGSTDRTAAIAKSFGASVLDFTWSMDFSAARNFGFRHARGDWILWLDAHDRLPDDSARRLRPEIQSVGPDIGGLLVQHLMPPDPDTGMGMVIKKTFLVRNTPGIRFRGRVHEQIRPAIRTSGYAIRDTDLQLRHAGYTGSPSVQREKDARYLAILEEERSERPDDPMLWYCLGMAYQRVGRRESAEAAFRRYLAMETEDDQRQKAHVYLAELGIENNDLAAALDSVNQGLARYPDHLELQYKLGYIMFSHKRYGEAAEMFRKVLARSAVVQLPNYCNLADIRFWPAFFLGVIALLTGKYQDALPYLSDARASCPNVPLVWQATAETLWRAGRRAEAEAALERLRELDPAEWTETRRHLCALGHTGNARKP